MLESPHCIRIKAREGKGPARHEGRNCPFRKMLEITSGPWNPQRPLLSLPRTEPLEGGRANTSSSRWMCLLKKRLPVDPTGTAQTSEDLAERQMPHSGVLSVTVQPYGSTDSTLKLGGGVVSAPPEPDFSPHLSTARPCPQSSEDLQGQLLESQASFTPGDIFLWSQMSGPLWLSPSLSQWPKIAPAVSGHLSGKLGAGPARPPGHPQSRAT